MSVDCGYVQLNSRVLAEVVVLLGRLPQYYPVQAK
jgi:hypothetical protein